MIRSFIVALREARTYLQDRAELAFSLLLPIVFFALMYGAFGGQAQFHATVCVVNEDQGGTYANLLLERLAELESLDVELLSGREADNKLERSDLLLVVYIPEGFSQRITDGEPVQLVFKQRGHGGQEGRIVASLVRSVAEEMNQEFQANERVKNNLAGRDIPEERIEVTVQKFLEREREHPIVEVREDTVGASPDMVNQFLPGIITMFVLFAINTMARTLVEERKLGTLERLMTTHLSVGQLFAGKFLANVSRGFVQTLILLALSYIVFQLFTPLSFVEALAIALLFSAATSTLGFIIASIARTEDQATWIGVSFTMIMVTLSGTFFAIPEGTVWYTLSRVSINTYANEAFKVLIAQGGSLADLGLEMGVLGGVIVVGLFLSRILFRVLPGGR